MPELTCTDLWDLIELIDALPEDECHPKTLALREKLHAMHRLLVMGDS